MITLLRYVNVAFASIIVAGLVYNFNDWAAIICAVSVATSIVAAALTSDRGSAACIGAILATIFALLLMLAALLIDNPEDVWSALILTAILAPQFGIPALIFGWLAADLRQYVEWRRREHAVAR